MAGRPRTRPDCCLDCARPMRTSRDPYTPGTVRHYGGGYCNGCSHRRNNSVNSLRVKRARSEYEGIVAHRRRRGIPEEGLAA